MSTTALILLAALVIGVLGLGLLQRWEFLSVFRGRRDRLPAAGTTPPRRPPGSDDGPG